MSSEQLAVIEATLEDQQYDAAQRLAAVKRRVDRARAAEVAGLAEAKDLVVEAAGLGMGQTEIANLCGVHRQTVRRWLGLDTHLNREEERRAERMAARAWMRGAGGSESIE